MFQTRKKSCDIVYNERKYTKPRAQIAILLIIVRVDGVIEMRYHFGNSHKEMPKDADGPGSNKLLQGPPLSFGHQERLSFVARR